jgi:hypothetical protein
MRCIIDFETIAELETPIHELSGAATTLQLLAERTDTDSQLRDAMFYLAGKMSDDARKLQDWFDVATMATKPDKN